MPISEIKNCLSNIQFVYLRLLLCFLSTLIYPIRKKGSILKKPSTNFQRKLKSAPMATQILTNTLKKPSFIFTSLYPSIFLYFTNIIMFWFTSVNYHMTKINILTNNPLYVILLKIYSIKGNLIMNILRCPNCNQEFEVDETVKIMKFSLYNWENLW